MFQSQPFSENFFSLKSSDISKMSSFISKIFSFASKDNSNKGKSVIKDEVGKNDIYKSLF